MAGILQEITIHWDPKDVDRPSRAFSEAIKNAGRMMIDPASVEIKPLVEPITITVPIEDRKSKASPQATEVLCLFFDTANQEHWVTQERGDQYPQWRQAFFLPRP